MEYQEETNGASHLHYSLLVTFLESTTRNHPVIRLSSRGGG